MRAAGWTEAIVAVTGEGPTWRELAYAMWWPSDREEYGPIILRIVKAGWLVSGTEPRSLRPGPTAAYISPRSDKTVVPPAVPVNVPPLPSRMRRRVSSTRRRGTPALKRILGLMCTANLQPAGGRLGEWDGDAGLV